MRMLTRGWWFARAMACHTLVPIFLDMSANSFASAMLTSRNVFYMSFTISAVVASVFSIWPVSIFA